MPSRVEIVVEAGPLRGQQFGYEDHDLVLFGRARDCHIRLPEQDATASRHHFILEVNPPQARVRDLGSLGGTFVNGKKYGGRAAAETPEEAARRQYPEVDLAEGDEIRAGQHVLRVHVHREITCVECGTPLAPGEVGRPERGAASSGPQLCDACRRTVVGPGEPSLSAPAAPRPVVATPPAIPTPGATPAPGAIPTSGATPAPGAIPTPGATPAPPNARPPTSAARPPAIEAHATERPAGAPAQAAAPGPAAPASVPSAAIPGASVPAAASVSSLSHLFQQIVGGGRRRAERGDAPEARRRFGEYEIEEELGRGAMGAVYLARHSRTNERVALKLLVAQAAVDAQSRRRFMREVEAISALRHPNVVAIRESGTVGDTFFFTMEWCTGGSLSAYVSKRGGPLPVAEARRFLEQTLDGMAAAHAAGYIHRDLKPENLLLARQDGQSEPLVAKVADFGLAKSFTDAGLSGLTVTGTRGGTYTYMPREQLLRFRDATPASDVWALGATFYVLLTRRPPRQAPSGQQLDPITLVLQGTTAPIRQLAPNVPEPLAAVIDRALQQEPSARYQSAGEMRRALG